MKPDKRALTQWTKSAISYKNYQVFIDKKTDKFKLTLIDLLYISNFKGGNATINEPETIIDNKLLFYSQILIDIESKFKNKLLSSLNDTEFEELEKKITLICKLTLKGTKTKIDGFSVSYLSALLSAYFPKLIPILDRRVLINLSLVNEDDVTKNGQIKDIQRFYCLLLKEIAILCKKENLSIREIDKSLFTSELREIE